MLFQLYEVPFKVINRCKRDSLNIREMLFHGLFSKIPCNIILSSKVLFKTAVFVINIELRLGSLSNGNLVKRFKVTNR